MPSIVWQMVLSFVTVAAIVTAIYFIVRYFEGEADDKAMSPTSRTFLTTYLMVMAVVLIYLLIKLFSLHFPDVQVNQPFSPPTLPESAKPAATDPPLIVQVIPAALTLDMGAVDVQLFGYNFAKKSSVFVNGIERQAKFVGEQLLVVPLTSLDTAAEASLSIVVTTDGKSASTSLPVLAPKANLQIRSKTFPITRETQLLLLALIAGALGSYIHAIRSLADYIGNRQLVASWFWFYMTKPFVGMALALVFYAAIRGGFVAGSPADAKSVNPFGVFAVAAMVGLFADKAASKLADIFDALFKADDQRKDKLKQTPLEITTATFADAAQNVEYAQRLDVKGGTAPYKWSVVGLPAGLSIDTASSSITGTPKAAGTSNVTLTVTDAAEQKALKTLALKVV